MCCYTTCMSRGQAMHDQSKRRALKMWSAFLLFIGIQVIMAGEAPVLQLNDGHKIPVVALGTGRGTAAGAPVDEVCQAVYWAIEAGYRHIDTAASYGDEPEVGQGIADAIAKGFVKREDLFVTTKLWSDKHAENQVVPALKESLKRLGLDYVDLYLIHFPIALNADGSPSDIDYVETWRGMEEAKKLGLAKSIGVSNFNITQIDRLFENSKIKPAVNQIEVNPSLTQEPLVSHCQEKGVAVMAYSPFGFLVTRKTSDAPPPRIDDPTLVAIGVKYGKTTSQVVLRYLLDRGLIIIPKSTNQKRLAQNLDLFDFKLTEDEVATISKFNKNVRVINPSMWKDYPNYPFERNYESYIKRCWMHSEYFVSGDKQTCSRASWCCSLLYFSSAVASQNRSPQIMAVVVQAQEKPAAASAGGSEGVSAATLEAARAQMARAKDRAESATSSEIMDQKTAPKM